MKKMTSTIGPSGELVIDDALLESAQLEEGDQVLVEVGLEMVTVRRVKSEPTMEDGSNIRRYSEHDRF